MALIIAIEIRDKLTQIKKVTKMTIEIGQNIPPQTIIIASDEGPKPTSTDAEFAGKKIALFAVPGAFTPTCSARHFPSYIDHLDELKAKGIDGVYCLSVNDAFVMAAWAKFQKSDGKITMIADGNGALTKSLGLELDASGFGMGIRSQRYGMVINDGVIEHLFVEQGGEYKVSSAEHMLANI